MLVLHLAPHVLDGVDGRFVVRLWAAAVRQLLHPEAAHVEQRVEHQPGQFDGLDHYDTHRDSLDKPCILLCRFPLRLQGT